MSKHSPQIRLQAALARYKLAIETCPHWDFDTVPATEDCCYELVEAAREMRSAREAAKETSK